MKEVLCTCTPSNRLASVCGNCNPSLVNKKKKDTTVLNFLKWANENHIELQIQYSFNDRIGIFIYNTEDGEELHCGFGDTIEEAIENLQNSISETGHLPTVIYDFPWDK